MCEPNLLISFGTFCCSADRSPCINVLSIATLKCWNWTWHAVMGKTEPMENLENWVNGKFSLAIMYFKCRKVIMCECLHINVLSVETSSCFSVETEPRTKQCGDRETEPMENLYLENGISASAIMKKLKNGHHFINICVIWKNFKSLTPLKFESLVFWVSVETEYRQQPLWKNQNVATIS